MIDFKKVKVSKIFNYVIGAGALFYSIHQMFGWGTLAGMFLMMTQATKDLIKFYIGHQK